MPRIEMPTGTRYLPAVSVPSTWDDRELPILLAIHHAAEAGKRVTDLQRVVDATGIDPAMASRSLRSLTDDRFVESSSHRGGGDEYENFLGVRLLPKGLREIGRWPKEGVEALLGILDNVITNEADDERRSAFERARDALQQRGPDVATSTVAGVLSGLLRGLAGL